VLVSYPDGPFDIGDEVEVVAEGCEAYVIGVAYYPTSNHPWGFSLRQNNAQRAAQPLIKYAWHHEEDLR
jgi:hypothetical protein